MRTTHGTEGEGSVDTAAKLFLACERDHEREAVLRWRSADQWEVMPDWRFSRQVLRLALYLRDRGCAMEGDRLAIVARTSAETLALEWASMLLGVAVGVLDPTCEGPDTQAMLDAFGPHVVFVTDASAAGELVLVRAERAAETAPRIPFREVLDLGGTLDTAERAQALRAHARRLPPARAALAAPIGVGHEVEWATLSQGRLAERLRREWPETPPQPGTTQYFDVSSRDPAMHLALHARVVDGLTQVVLGTPPPPPKATRSQGIRARLGM
jgi:acyl-CoA synthetase (AMP-forming)/AMP-acid ligase II